MFDSDKAGDMSATIGLRFGNHEFLASVANGVLDVSPGDASSGDVTVTCDQNALVGVIYGGVSLSEMTKTGVIEVSGKTAILRRFCKLFPLPASAPVLPRS